MRGKEQPPPNKQPSQRPTQPSVARQPRLCRTQKNEPQRQEAPIPRSGPRLPVAKVAKTLGESRCANNVKQRSTQGLGDLGYLGYINAEEQPGLCHTKRFVIPACAGMTKGRFHRLCHALSARNLFPSSNFQFAIRNSQCLHSCRPKTLATAERPVGRLCRTFSVIQLSPKQRHRRLCQLLRTVVLSDAGVASLGEFQS